MENWRKALEIQKSVVALLWLKMSESAWVYGSGGKRTEQKKERK